MCGDGFEGLCGLRAPSTKRFDDEGKEEESRISAVLGMATHLFVLPHFDGRGRVNGRPVDDGVLGWGNDANIKGNPSSVDPVLHEDVGGSRLRSWDEGGHFLLRVKPSELGLFEDLVPNPVMSTPSDPVVVAAVHGVVTELVQRFIAVIGRAC